MNQIPPPVSRAFFDGTACIVGDAPANSYHFPRDTSEPLVMQDLDTIGTRVTSMWDCTSALSYLRLLFSVFRNLGNKRTTTFFGFSL